MKELYRTSQQQQDYLQAYEDIITLEKWAAINGWPQKRKPWYVRLWRKIRGH
jgi:hypothetical protein